MITFLIRRLIFDVLVSDLVSSYDSSNTSRAAHCENSQSSVQLLCEGLCFGIRLAFIFIKNSLQMNERVENYSYLVIT